jgi:hypothetical protein
MARHRIAILIPSLLLAVLCWQPETSSESKQLYSGAAHLYSLDDVTIVYPGGDEAGSNRTSAEWRAAYLHHIYAVEAHVTSDTEVTEEQLAGNLLLLGWENRLLGTGEAPSPYQRSGGRMTFLGSIPVAEGEDLLFAYRSPYGTESTLVFWSRIDPELDRLLALPFLGSDWGIYRDFKVVAQGSFESGSDWPPARNPVAEKRHHDLRLKEPATAESEHYTLHYSRTALDPEKAAAILETRESALATAAKRLGSSAEGFRIQLFIYGSDERKKELTGVASSAHTIPGRLESHMTVARARSSDTAEELHLLASRVMGECHSTAMYDGLAIAMGKPFEESDLATYAALLVQGDSLPTLEELLDEGELPSLMKRRLGQPASGLMVGWIEAVGGREAVAAAYTAARPTVADLARWTGREPSAIEDEFKSWVEALASGAEQAVAFRKALGEARSSYERGDLKGAMEALRRALEIRPDHPETLYRLAMTLIRAEESGAAEKRFLRLAELEVAPQHNRYVIFAHYQLGKLYDGRGKHKKARTHYLAMLELPDEHDAHSKAREALGEAPP